MEEEISIPVSSMMSDASVALVARAVALPLCAAPESGSPLPPPLSPAGGSLDLALPCGFRFHAAGREDVDVRMLGEGRPCMVELMGAKSVLVPASAFARMEQAVNSVPGVAPVEAATGGRPSGGVSLVELSANPLVELAQVRPASKADFDALQDGSQDKRKRYVAVCWTSTPTSAAQLRERLDHRSSDALELRQKTPMRVLHRRSLLTRRKMIYDMRTEWINPHFFVRTMCAGRACACTLPVWRTSAHCIRLAI